MSIKPLLTLIILALASLTGTARGETWFTDLSKAKICVEPQEGDSDEFDINPVRELKVRLYTTQKYGCSGDCDYNSIANVMRLAELKLWTEVKEPTAPGGVMHAPCGGALDCRPVLAANAHCFVEETDCNFGEPGKPYQDPKVLKTYLLDCRGDIYCRAEGLNLWDCCVITKVVKGKIYWNYNEGWNWSAGDI